MRSVLVAFIDDQQLIEDAVNVFKGGDFCRGRQGLSMMGGPFS